MRNKQLHTVAIILVISIGIIHFGIMQSDFEDLGLFYNISIMISLAVVIVMSAIIYQKYAKQRRLSILFLFLTLAYVSYLFGEIGWFVFENVFFEYPYQTVADIGFFFDFVFTIIFLIAAIRLFSKLTRYDIGAASLVMSVIIAGYLVFSIDAETETYDLLFGLIFIIASSAVFSYSIIAMNTFWPTKVHISWVIIALAFMVSTTADALYYTTENIGVYTYADPSNTLWIVSNALLVYALILHRRVL